MDTFSARDSPIPKHFRIQRRDRAKYKQASVSMTQAMTEYMAVGGFVDWSLAIFDDSA